MRKYRVTLTQAERKELQGMSKRGRHRSQKILNVLILLNCDEGDYQINRQTNAVISNILEVSPRRIDRLKKRFVEEGLDIALDGHKGKRVYEKKADGDFEAHLVALSCSKPPQGFSSWSLRLLADKVVELQYVDNISHETIRQVLKKTKLNHGVQKVG